MENISHDPRTRQFSGMILTIAVLWAVVAYFFGYPYQLVPSEDLRHLSRPFEWLHQPIFSIVMESFKTFSSGLGLGAVNSYLLLSLFCLLGTGVLIAWLVYRLSESVAWAAAGIFLFLSSGWTLHYLLYGNYTVWATLLFLGAMALVQAAGAAFEASSNRIPSAGPSVSAEIVYITLAGMVSGFLFLSGPAAPVMISLVIATIWVLFRQLPPRRRLAFLSFYLVPLGVVILPFAFRLFPELLVHWRMNVTENNLTLTPKEWGYGLPKVWGIFWRMGSLFSPLPVILWTVALTFFGVQTTFRNKSRPAWSTVWWINLGLIHVLLIELLPFTKLSRGHFPGWPLVIIGLVLALQRMSRELAPRMRLMLGLGFTGIVVASAVQGTLLIRQAEAQKRAAIRILSPLFPNTNFYALDSDPHARVIEAWLGRPLNLVGKLSDVKKEPGKRTGFLLGPHGPGSGLSGLRASLLRDFYPERQGLKKPIGASEMKLPFHAYFPTFLMEEEVSQALYFLGRGADFRNPHLQLTLWTWD